MTCDSPGCGVEFGLFNWKYMCGGCARPYCSTHIHARSNAAYWNQFSFFGSGGEGLCQRCLDRFEGFREAAKQVKTWSTNYKGRVSFDAGGPSVRLQTGWRREKEACEHCLRVEAAAQGMQVVHGVEYEKASESEGNYKYTVWRATGTGARSVR